MLEDVLMLPGLEELVKEAKSVELDKSVGDGLDEMSVLARPRELVDRTRSIELDEPIEDVLKEGSVLVESVELVEETRSELDESAADVLEDGSALEEVSVLVESEELLEETRSDELGDAVMDMLEETSVLEELIKETRSVELDESAEGVSERLAEDEESTKVLVTLKIPESVELIEVEGFELIAELVGLTGESVGELDVVALALEGTVLEILSVVEDMEVAVGKFEDTLAEDETPVSIELEMVEDAEEVEPLSMLNIEVGRSDELDESLPELEAELADIGADEGVLVAVELIIEVAGPAPDADEEALIVVGLITEVAGLALDANEEVLIAVELIVEVELVVEVAELALDVAELDIELVLCIMEVELLVVAKLLVLETTELELLDVGKLLVLDTAEVELLVAGVELEVILDVMKVEVELVEKGADEEVLVTVELIIEVAGPALDVDVLDTELVLCIMEVGLLVFAELLVLETTELELLDVGKLLVLDIREAKLLVTGVELEVILDVKELETLATCDVLEILVALEEACVDDMLEDVAPELLLDAELGVLEIPGEFLLLDAVLLWRDVAKDIGVDRELDELPKEDNIADDKFVSFPSVA